MKKAISLCIVISLLFAILPQIVLSANATTYKSEISEQNSVELRVYTAFPDSMIGTEQDVKVRFSLYINGKEVPIEEYVLGISNPSVVESTETIDYNGSRIISFKGISPGSSNLTFTENSTGVSISFPIEVENNCNYFRCSLLPIPHESSGSIYIADYSCTVDKNGDHDIAFNAYNTSYSYGTVEVYNEVGTLIKLIPLDPRSDGSGTEKVVNGFKWVWEDIKDIFDGDTQFYTKDRNAKHTPVKLDNIPENAEIVISSDGNVSDFTTLYTGVDVFVRTVFAASSIDLKTDGQVATVKELMNALADSLIKSISHEETEKMIYQGLIKEATESISTTIAFTSSTDSISDIYETVYNLFQSLDIDAESIMLNMLKGMGYSIADTAFTTAVPLYKIVNFVDQILETAWPLVEYQYNLDRGKMEIHVDKHGLYRVTAVQGSNDYKYEFINGSPEKEQPTETTEPVGKTKETSEKSIFQIAESAVGLHCEWAVDGDFDDDGSDEIYALLCTSSSDYSNGQLWHFTTTENRCIFYIEEAEFEMICDIAKTIPDWLAVEIIDSVDNIDEFISDLERQYF